MVIFLTSVRHPVNVESYAKTSDILKNTLESISSQTHSDYRIFVVCNKIPLIKNKFEKVEYITVDFPPPSTKKHYTFDLLQLDKGSKYAIGAHKALKYSPDYFMFVDSDDLISNKIVEIINKEPICSGWYIDKGYKKVEGLPFLEKIDNFHEFCGSSYILNSNLLKELENLRENMSIEEIKNSISQKTLINILGDHQMTKSVLQERGVSLNPFPTRAAIWNVGTGTNYTGHYICKPDTFLSKEISSEFCTKTKIISWFYLIKNLILRLVSFPVKK